MLDVINGLANGWVASHVIDSFARHGVLEAISARPMTLKKLASRYRGNAGHLHAGLQLLYELGWVEWVEPDRYGAATGASLARQVPSDLLELTQLPVVQALTTEQSEQFEHLLRWLDRCSAGWSGAEPMVVNVLDGALLTPLLAHLYTLGSDVLEQTQPSDISAAALHAVQTLFIQRGWGHIEAAGFELTPSGQALLASSGALGTIVSYTPMFRHIDDLLFGEALAIFGRDEQGHELHVDRTLNVIASGVQHQSHFAELDTLILRIFDQLPLAEQPRYIADMGCGDGSLLRRIYELIKTRSARGQALTEYPLTLIGADYNALSLEATGKTLTGLPHLLVRGDIGDPQQLITDLAAVGIEDPENILHVRSFLDHDRPFLPVEDKRAVKRREGLNYTGVYIAHDGRETEPSHAIQGLVEHLRRWRMAVSHFGLLLLEVHCLQPHTVRRVGSLTESAHFDAYHAFSGQQLVEASVFLMAAAEAGFFPAPGMSQAIPKNLSFTRISLHRLLPQSYTVRHPVLADLPRLKQLDRLCQPKALRTPTAEIKRRVRDFAQGQMVLELDGRIVAALYTQRIDSPEVLRNTCYAELAQLHQPEGRYVQLLGLFVAPEVQGRGFSDALIDLMLVYAATLDGVAAVIGVTRCANFVQHKATCTLDHYIQLLDERGQLKDPMLHFHTSHGAMVREVLRKFRPEDIDNEGAGILIEYKLRFSGAAVAEVEAPQAISERSVLADHQIEPAVRGTVMQVLGSQRAAAYGSQVPLMEMGLSSLELLELRLLLSARMEKSLAATFLFSYGTPEAIIGYFRAQATDQPPMPQTTTTVASTDVAIIGLACRLPNGANNPDQFWQALLAAHDGVGALPANRRSLRGPCRWQGGFLDDVDCFDAGFFRISPREAELLDPQQRLLLEVTWEALESAAIAPAMLRGTRSGVFVGLMGSDYEDLIASNGNTADINAHFATGNACSVAAGRLSYFFDWQGPALSIDTACSSSLVAVHTACRSLLGGECTLALAAGVNLLLDDKRFLAYEQAGMLSPHGRCRTFDASADGYVRGEGCAAVVLKRLSDAQADEDPIMAVIRGSAINQDGSSSGLTAPNQLAQQAVIEAALAQAGLAPHEIGYLEAHGTGTKLGDPIEVMAAAQVLGAGRSADQPLLIGSLKSAMGHLEAAAGIAGLIKTVLSMQHGVIPAQLHFATPNPHIPWERLPLRVVAQAQAWPAGPKRAGISSFGFSGTNAHVIVEEYIGPQRSPTEVSGAVVVVLSAKRDEQLRDQAQQLLAYLERHEEVNLADLAYTLQVGREPLGVRVALVARSMNELKEQLSRYAQGEVPQDDLYQGQQTLALLRDDAKRQRTVEAWLAKGELGKLAQGWMQGLEVAWESLYGEAKPQRISLPTYPFAKERYWVPQTVGGAARQLHPLVHQNTSDLSEQRFSTTFTGEEFFLRDHVVHGERVVPGVAQLEWARAAVMLASGGELGTAGRSVLLQEVTWLHPLVVAQPQEVQIGLEMQEDGRISFEIYRGSGDEAVVYSQGWAQFAKEDETPWVDLEAARRQCERILTGEACYPRFAQLGLGYGPSFQIVHELRVGRNIAVGALRLPGESPAGYVWTPNVLDGALQTSVWLTQGTSDGPLALPFTVAQVRQWGELPMPAWVVVRPAADDSAAVRKFDIEIVDKTGRVALRLSGFSTRSLHNAAAGEAALTASAASTVELPTLNQVSPAVTTQEQMDFDAQRAVHRLSHSHLASRVRQGVCQSMVETLLLDENQLVEDRDFAEYGVDSLTGVALVNAINTQLSLNLSTTVVFKYATIEQLSAHIISVYSERLSADSVATTEDRPISALLNSPNLTGCRRRQRFQALAPLRPRSDERSGSTYYRLLLTRPGSIDDLRIVEDVMAPLGEHDVRIEVRAFSLNFGDLLCVKGLYPTQPPYPFTPGFEASGVVTAVGRSVRRVAIGDAVVALAGEALGAHASVLTCPQSQIFPCPAGLSFEAACAVPVVAVTMIECFKKAQLKAGQSILIQTAAGGTGLIAVQLAQYAGAEIYATAGSQAKLDYLASLGIPHRINYLEEDFEIAVARLTNGRGVDVVINTLAGDALQKGLNCLAPGGHYIEIAMTALMSAHTIDLSRLSDNQTFHSVDLRKLGRNQSGVMQTAMHELAHLLEQGVIHPTLSQVFTFEKIQDAYRWLENRQNIGKVVVSIPEAYCFRARETAVKSPAVTTQERMDFDAQRAVYRLSHSHLASRVRQGVRQSMVETLLLDENQLVEDRDFAEYGVDSLTGVALVNAINTQLSLSLPTTVVFKYATIEQLSAHIISVYRERLSADSVAITEDRPISTLPSFPNLTGRRRRQRFQAPAPLRPRGDERAGPAALPTSFLVGELTLVPVWEVMEETGEAWPLPQQQVVLVSYPQAARSAWLTHYPQAKQVTLTGAESVEALIERFRGDSPLDHLVWWVSPTDVLAAQLGFKLIKALLELGYGSHSLGLTVLTQQAQAVWLGEEINAAAASVHGLIGSLAKEYTRWRIRLLDVPMHEDVSLAWLLGQPANDRGDARAYRHGQGYRQRLVPCRLPAAVGSVYRTGGVYVILGGAGGLGVTLSEYLIQHYQAQIVWLGRRAEDATIAQQCARLGALGPTPLYLQADATDRQALELAHKAIRQRFGAIHGVVHAAIVLADRSLAQMDEETFALAWSTKVASAVHLTEVFGQEAMDFLLFFSSLQSFMKQPGQSNYAAGCCFADAFAQGLCSQPYPVKVMHWGYWGSVGVVASSPYRERMAQMGIGSIEPPEAMVVLEHLLAGPVDQLGFVKTTQAAVTDMLGIVVHETVTAAPAAPVVVLPQVAEVTVPERAAQDMAELEAQLAPLLRMQLATLGWLGEDACLPALYVRWHAHSLHLLEVRGLLAQAQGAEEPAKLWAQWETYCAAAQNKPTIRAQVQLVDTTLRALPALLRGEMMATEVLFPQGRLDRVEGIYCNHPVADYFNAALTERLIAYVQARLQADPKTTLRLLEIGAGTGGTSVAVFAQLAPYASQIEQYCYTDVSPAFLLHAQQHYAPQVPYLHTQKLDIERDPMAQDFLLGYYDIVVATNVLHATHDIRRTVRHAKTLLKDSGLLLLNELTETGLFAHLTFGLLDGWWLAEDTALRIVGTPGLLPSAWRQVLAAEGFKAITFPAKAAHGLGQQIMAAFSNGVVRQLRYAAPHPRPVSPPIQAMVRAPGASEQHLPVAARAILGDSTSGANMDKIIPVRTTGAQRPLFLISDIYELNFYFFLLGARVDEDIPIYGLPDIPLNEHQLHTMESLAAHLLGIMRSVQPEGPYRLGGWSFAGVVAYEIAIQLINQGQAVEFVGLFDTPLLMTSRYKEWLLANSSPQNLLLDLCTALGKMQRDEKLTVRTKLEDVMGTLDFDELAHQCREADILPPQWKAYTTEELRQMLVRVGKHRRAMVNYVVPPLSIPIHLFFAESREQNLGDEFAPFWMEHFNDWLGWDTVLPIAQIQRISVPGDHLSIMKEPNVTVLGQAVSRVLYEVVPMEIE